LTFAESKTGAAAVLAQSTWRVNLKVFSDSNATLKNGRSHEISKFDSAIFMINRLALTVSLQEFHCTFWTPISQENMEEMFKILSTLSVRTSFSLNNFCAWTGNNVKMPLHFLLTILKKNPTLNKVNCHVEATTISDLLSLHEAVKCMHHLVSMNLILPESAAVIDFVQQIWGISR
ncbi:hypothetical protein PFISCL1PPCAC_6591, partial [Pristionchus fissidentatus]